MASPQVSVVIPTYMRPDRLDRAVASVVAQTFDNWELIVVNDDPTDSVRNVLPADERITCLQHDENRGAPAARNTGIQASTGDYIALLDDDDEWKPTKLERQVLVLDASDEKTGMVYTGVERVKNGEVRDVYTPTAEGDILSILLQRNVIPSPTPLIRRDCFEKVGRFDERLQSNQDLDMWIRIADEFAVTCLSEALARSHVDHSDRISEDIERLYQGERCLLDKHEHHFINHPAAHAYRYHELGMYATYTDRKHEAVRYFLKSIRLGRRDPLTFSYAVLSLLPDPVHTRVFALRRLVSEHGFTRGLSQFVSFERQS